MEVANRSLEDEKNVSRKGFFFHFYDCWEKNIPSRELTYTPNKAYLKMMFLFPRWDMLVSWRVFYETILIIHLLTKDSDIHSHYLSLLFWDLLSRILFPRDSVRSWATETRSNSEYQAPRSSIFFSKVPLGPCWWKCWLVTWRPLVTSLVVKPL